MYNYLQVDNKIKKGMKPKLYTHINPDLDAIAACWAIITFISLMEDAEIVFVPADWDGEGMRDIDMAVDIHAGGKGIKGDNSNGRVHSAFSSILQMYCSPQQQRDLEPLRVFVDAQDAHGSATKYLAPSLHSSIQRTLSAVSIGASLRGYQALYPDNDALVFKRMSELLHGLFKLNEVSRRAKKEVEEKLEILPSGKVAIIRGAMERSLSRDIFGRGVKVYIYEQGNNIGLVKADDVDESIYIDEVREIIRQAGEENEWFYHPAGFLIAWGTRKAPKYNKSLVSARKLADALDKKFATKKVA